MRFFTFFIIAAQCSLILHLAYCVKAEATIYLDRKNPFKPQLPVAEESKEVQVIKPVIGRPKTAFQQPRQILQDKPLIEKNPTAPAVTLPELKVSGLIWNSNRPQAIINDQVVDLGDTVNSAKIIDIRKDGIDVLYRGQQSTINP